MPDWVAAKQIAAPMIGARMGRRLTEFMVSPLVYTVASSSSRSQTSEAGHSTVPGPRALPPFLLPSDFDQRQVPLIRRRPVGVADRGRRTRVRERVRHALHPVGVAHGRGELVDLVWFAPGVMSRGLEKSAPTAKTSELVPWSDRSGDRWPLVPLITAAASPVSDGSAPGECLRPSSTTPWNYSASP